MQRREARRAPIRRHLALAEPALSHEEELLELTHRGRRPWVRLWQGIRRQVQPLMVDELGRPLGHPAAANLTLARNICKAALWAARAELSALPALY